MIKITFFFLLTISLTLPLGAYAETSYHPILDEMEEKTRAAMEAKSMMPENEKNSFEYWCLSDQLYTIVEGKTWMGKDIKQLNEHSYDPLLTKIADGVLEKYSSRDHFVGPNFEPSMDMTYDVTFTDRQITFYIDYKNKLKMSSAQEIISSYNQTTIARLPSWGVDEDSCSDVLEKTLDITVAANAGHSMYMNVRGDLVMVDPSSISKLM